MPRRPRYKTHLHGLLPVDKPVGPSTMDVVRRVRSAAGFCKTGHAGTLDPLASGLVVCCLGDATRAVESLMGHTKVYEAGIDLSAFTTTDDREGERDEVAVATPPTGEEVASACAAMVGEIEQTPPAFSAVHVGGRRAYELARAGKDVNIEPKVVRIDAVEVLDYAWPGLRLRVTCGRGTYIRSLARDLGRRLGTGGHLSSLRRTVVGAFTVDQAWSLERVEQGVTQADLLAVPGA